MSAKKTKKAQAIPTPQNQAAAEVLLGELGRLQRELAAIELNMNAALAHLKEQFEQQAAPLNEQAEAAFAALHAWAEAHRDELLKDGGKTAKLATGELSWRTTPPSVRVTSADVVLETLKRLGLDRFIRTKDEIDKTAILSEPDAVAG